MLQVHESYVNETKGYHIGESDWYEPWTDKRGKLFLDMQREYGRCIGKAYNDVLTHTPQVPNCPMVARMDVPKWDVVPVGWVFSKRMAYEDARGRWDYRTESWKLDPERDYYTREVWVILREVPDDDD